MSDTQASNIFSRVKQFFQPKDIQTFDTKLGTLTIDKQSAYDHDRSKKIADIKNKIESAIKAYLKYHKLNIDDIRKDDKHFPYDKCFSIALKKDNHYQI
jgi:hypothetical protein